VTTPLTSCPTFERSAELGDVVVIVARKPGDPVGEGEATPAEVDTSAQPLCLREGSQERQYLGPPPAKCGQSLTGVVAEILALLGPSRGIEWVANRASDPPRSQIVRARPEHEDARLIESHDGVEPDLEELLDITQVADDFLGGPIVGVGAYR
jgi:hypothetical protein